MRKSATEILLPQTYKEVWKRGENYVSWKKVKPISMNNGMIEALIKGKDDYIVVLKFGKEGLIRRCNCPYSIEAPPTRPACKHMVAVAIFWDEKRGIKRPSKRDVSLHTLAPPPISRQAILNLFKNPLKADLDKVRIITEYSSWLPQPHARLPNRPKINDNPGKPLKILEVKKAFQEMESWTKRSLYDPYFCSGEMSAAFCELLDVIKSRLKVSKPKEVIGILALCVDWFYRKFNKIIDGTEGVWIFPPVRIGNLVALMIKKYPEEALWRSFRRVVRSAGEKSGVKDLDEKKIAEWIQERL